MELCGTLFIVRIRDAIVAIKHNFTLFSRHGHCVLEAKRYRQASSYTIMTYSLELDERFKCDTM